MASKVSRVPAAVANEAVEHFEKLLAFETDCSDVHHAIVNRTKDFVLLDVRSEELHAKGHLPESIALPHWKITDESIRHYPQSTLFVVYCAGPHCNGADNAALKLARLSRPVKKMIGGVTGWLDEGFELVE